MTGGLGSVFHVSSSTCAQVSQVCTLETGIDTMPVHLLIDNAQTVCVTRFLLPPAVEAYILPWVVANAGSPGL